MDTIVIKTDIINAALNLLSGLLLFSQFNWFPPYRHKFSFQYLYIDFAISRSVELTEI